MSAHSRTAAMQWLHREHHWAGFSAPDFHDPSPADRTALIGWLHRRCASMRAAGIAGAHHYDPPLHRELLRLLRAERAALQALRSLSSEAPKATLQLDGRQRA